MIENYLIKVSKLLSIKTKTQNCRFLSRFIFNNDGKYDMITDMCRDFASKELKPIADKMDKTSCFDMSLISKMGKLGLMSATVPEKYGGSGMDYISYVIAGEELAKGTPEQLKKFAKPYMDGSRMGCFALTEPDNGSDAGAASTTATFDNGTNEWIINGSKQFITAANVSETALVFATSDKSKKHKGISAFLVELNSKGVTIGRKEEKLGIRASPTCSITLENVRIPKDNILGQRGDGFKIAMETLDVGRISVASQGLGISQAALEEAVSYAKERKSFNNPLFDLQIIQAKLADMETRINASRLLSYQAAYMKDMNLNITKSAAMAKLYSSETATFVTHQALQIHGGVGFINDYPLERHYRDARITEIYEGTSEIQRVVIAHALRKEYGN